MRSISCDLPSERLAPSYISCSLRPGGRACRAGGAGGQRARGQLRGRGARLTGARRAARGGTWPGGVVWGVGPLATGGPPTAQGLPRGGAPLDRLERPPTSERVTVRGGGCITPWKQGAPATVPPLSGKCPARECPGAGGPASVPQVSRGRINILPGFFPQSVPRGVPQVSRSRINILPGCPAGVPQVSRSRINILPGCPAGVPQVSRRCPAGVPGPEPRFSRVSREVSRKYPAGVPRPDQRCSAPPTATLRHAMLRLLQISLPMHRSCPPRIPSVC